MNIWSKNAVDDALYEELITCVEIYNKAQAAVERHRTSFYQRDSDVLPTTGLGYEDIDRIKITGLEIARELRQATADLIAATKAYTNR